MSKVPDDLIQIGEASRIFERSVDTLRKWDKANKGPHVWRVGGRRLYSESECRGMKAVLDQFENRT
jgi:DNA-binding transcriptional MerR regulator